MCRPISSEREWRRRRGQVERLNCGHSLDPVRLMAVLYCRQMTPFFSRLSPVASIIIRKQECRGWPICMDHGRAWSDTVDGDNGHQTIRWWCGRPILAAAAADVGLRHSILAIISLHAQNSLNSTEAVSSCHPRRHARARGCHEDVVRGNCFRDT